MVQISAYAVHMVIILISMRTLGKKKIQKLKDAAQKVELIINLRKTNLMRIRDIQSNKISTGDYCFEKSVLTSVIYASNTS